MKKILVPLITIFITGIFAAAQTDSTTLVKVNDKAPVFSCRTIEGKTLDIGKLKGKIILINFFATWCGPCNQELPGLQKNIWEKYKDNRNFQLIIVGREQTEKEIADFVSARKFTMPFVSDPKRDIYSRYATQFIPRNIIIGKDGKVLYQSMGYSESEFKKMESLLAEKLKE